MMVSFDNFMNKYLIMDAPMSRNIKNLLSNAKNSRKLSRQVLEANRLGINPVIVLGDRKITLVRVSPLSVRPDAKTK